MNSLESYRIGRGALRVGILEYDRHVIFHRKTLSNRDLQTLDVQTLRIVGHASGRNLHAQARISVDHALFVSRALSTIYHPKQHAGH